MRLRDAVRVVTDGTLGLLSRNLPVKNDKGYASNSDPQEDIKPVEQTPNIITNGYAVTTQNYNYSDASSDSANAPAVNYTPSEGQMSHQQTPYPAATQYSPYLDTASNTSDLTYAQQENQNYPSYSAPNTDSVEAPLIAALTAQASQVAPSTWQRSSIQVNTAPTQAWQNWTTAITDNAEPQDCYSSASALIQLGGRDVSNGDTTQPNTTISEVQNGVVGEQGHLGGQVPSGAVLGTWPFVVFDIGTNGANGTTG